MATKKKRGGYGFSVNLTGPGTIFTLGIIALAVGMGVLMTRGVTPRAILSDPPETGMIERIEDDETTDGKNLQLRTIKFRECESTLTIDLLLDRSGSMGDRTPSGITKIARLQEAVGQLLVDADDDSIIGIQSFDSGSIRDDVPISYYRDVRSFALLRVQAMRPGATTPTQRALAFSYEKLSEAIPNFPPDRHFNFIFVSDGKPVPDEQDPRRFTPNPADQIKDLGVTVYSLGIFDGNQSQNPELANLLRSVASSPNHYYAANTGDDVKLLLAQISQRICQSQQALPTIEPAP